MARKRCLFLDRIQSILKNCSGQFCLSSILASVKKRAVRYFLLLILFLLSGATPVVAQAVAQSLSAIERVEQSQQLYQNGEFDAAIALLQQAAAQFATPSLNRAMILSNLSLAYQQQSHWEEAEHSITAAIALLRSIPDSQQQANLLAQALSVQGQLQLTLGQAELALAAFQEATALFKQGVDTAQEIHSLVNQSIALQGLGFYRQAVQIFLEPIGSDQEQTAPLLKILPNQPDDTQAIAYRTLGTALRVVGDSDDVKLNSALRPSFEPSSNDLRLCQQQSLAETRLLQSQYFLQQSLNASDGQNVGETLLALGNTARTAYYHTKDNFERTEFFCNRIEVQQLFVNEAIDYYRQAADVSPSVTVGVQARLNHLSFLIDFKRQLKELTDIEVEQSEVEQDLIQPSQFGHERGAGVPPLAGGAAPTPPLHQPFVTAVELSREMSAKLPAQLEQLPTLLEHIDNLSIENTAIYAQINLARSLVDLMKWSAPDETHWQNPQRVEQLLHQAIERSNLSNNLRAKAYAIGSLGGLYEVIGTATENQGVAAENFEFAKSLTSEALKVAEDNQAPDITYQWQWQLGRIYKQQGQLDDAKGAYRGAIDTLKLLRQNYLTGLENLNISFSFRDKVEPVYLELIQLYLPTSVEAGNRETDESDITLLLQEDAQKAIDVFEELQVVELENFLRCRLSDTVGAPLEDQEDEDSSAAFLYPIVLSNRLELLLKLPNQATPLRRTAQVSKTKVEAAVAELRKTLDEGDYSNPVPQAAKDLYSWIFRQERQLSTVEAELQNQEIKTLVFVLGSGSAALRNLPVSALHDGEKYLVEHSYSIALNLTPALPRVRPFNSNTHVLSAGVTKANYDPERQEDASALPGVATELDQIQELDGDEKLIAPTQLRDEAFTLVALETAINSEPFTVVHLATHGEFGSDAESTFVLGYRERITAAQLSRLIQNREENRRQPIELLILSACKTATSDRRAVLGLAGLSIQAGARSTVASLTRANDEATSDLMISFYRKLFVDHLPISEALHAAQLEMLQSNREIPLVLWAPFILVGNWR